MAVSALGLAVALGSSACWAGLDATRKALVRSVPPAAAAMWLSLAQVPGFAAWAAAGGELRFELAPYALPGFGALGLHVVANVLLMKALSVSPLSATIPFLSFTPVFTSALAFFVLGERPSLWQWGGVALVVLGALFVNATPGEPPWRSLRRERGSLMMIGVAGCWSLTANLDKMALDHASLPVHATVQTAGVGLALLGYLLVRRAPLGMPRRAWPSFAGSVLFATGALALQLWAIQLVLVGLVETLKRAVGMSSSVLVGRVAFGEAITGRRALAVAVMGAGTALALLG
ncbi:MAG TPA: DMT family transporter [Sandaracinaceae bacterium LLY-WYZ-13_1]|nr:DMT family transporter [Sandaracinaceae bacterium LLY-WYZ-13_1]